MKGLIVSQTKRAANFLEGQVNRFEKLLTEKQKCFYLIDSEGSFSQCIVLIVMNSVLMTVL